MTLKIVTTLALGMALALSACATTGGSVSQSVQWEGKDTAALTAQWGTPQETKTLGDGSTLWIYSKTSETTIAGQLPVKTTKKQRTESYVVNGVTMTRQVQYDEATYEPGRLSYCEARFTIKDDVVTSAAFKGDGCPS
jgi:hypothetical protein